MKRRKAPPLYLARLLLVLTLLILLELAIRIGLINRFFVVLPSELIPQVLRDLVDREFLTLVGITFYETAAAFLFASVVGVGIGYLLWRSRRLGVAYEPLIAGLFASPIILLYPIFLVIFGRTPLAIIAQGAIFGVLPVILFTRQAFAGVSPTLLKVAASMNLSTRDRFRYILLPAAAPTIFTGLRLGLTYILIGVVAMEYIVQIGGLGKLVAETSLRLSTDELYSGITLVVAISVLFIYLTQRVENAVRR
ncbi:ABC transporter permease subunit [Rubrobacter marinus]|uniref:ABC transporter permease subunit n=1 Tax=Rubrobacter marinus TaxID=2653852 RepID=A0A6G8Q0J9_9ACTN|nr:ABC transporter permease subunit [Rubrobacter marinus]QIN80004.1 ABC transporter permease subunit [Rubrobacter marinus]